MVAATHCEAFHLPHACLRHARFKESLPCIHLEGANGSENLTHTSDPAIIARPVVKLVNWLLLCKGPFKARRLLSKPGKSSLVVLDIRCRRRV